MTPLERWTAAVALQYRVAAELETLEGEAYCDAVNGSRAELIGAARAFEESGGGIRQREWLAAYNAIRDVELRVAARIRRRETLTTIETVRQDACAVLARIAQVAA